MHLEKSTYTHGTSPEMLNVMSTRTAKEWLAFVLPYIKDGDHILDCGCGPGTIDLDLAKILKSSKVVGIDINTKQFEASQRIAEENGVNNLEFREGNILSLPFPDASFDAVVSITAIQHQRDPLKALKEIRRVLKPGGVIGIKDEDWKSLLWEPITPDMEKFTHLLTQVWEYNGGQPFYPRKQRSLLLEAGFERPQMTAIARSFGTPERTRWVADNFLKGHFIEPNFTEVAIQKGWVDRPTLEKMRRDVIDWAERPDGFWSLTFCEAVAWAN